MCAFGTLLLWLCLCVCVCACVRVCVCVCVRALVSAATVAEWKRHLAAAHLPVTPHPSALAHPHSPLLHSPSLPLALPVFLPAFSHDDWVSVRRAGAVGTSHHTGRQPGRLRLSPPGPRHMTGEGLCVARQCAVFTVYPRKLPPAGGSHG